MLRRVRSWKSETFAKCSMKQVRKMSLFFFFFLNLALSSYLPFSAKVQPKSFFILSGFPSFESYQHPTAEAGQENEVKIMPSVCPDHIVTPALDAHCPQRLQLRIQRSSLESPGFIQGPPGTVSSSTGIPQSHPPPQGPVPWETPWNLQPVSSQLWGSNILPSFLQSQSASPSATGTYQGPSYGLDLAK